MAAPFGKTGWTAEEDSRLLELVEIHGPKRWAVISVELETKGSKQCRRRWKNFLSADIKKGGWSPEEDAILLESHQVHGNKWTEIAKVVGGRTDNAVKNRYAALMKRNERVAAGYIPRAPNKRRDRSLSDISEDESTPTYQLPGSKRAHHETTAASRPARGRPSSRARLNIDVVDPAGEQPLEPYAPPAIVVHVDTKRFPLQPAELQHLAELNELDERFKIQLCDEARDMPGELPGCSPGPVIVSGSLADVKILHDELLTQLKMGLTPLDDADLDDAQPCSLGEWRPCGGDGAGRPPSRLHAGHAALLQRIFNERLAHQTAAEAAAAAAAAGGADDAAIPWKSETITSSSTLLAFPAPPVMGPVLSQPVIVIAPPLTDEELQYLIDACDDTNSDDFTSAKHFDGDVEDDAAAAPRHDASAAAGVDGAVTPGFDAAVTPGGADVHMMADDDVHA